MVVITANKKQLFDVDKGICLVNTSREYKGKINVFYTGEINSAINGEKIKSVMLASCDSEREAEKYLEWFCDDYNAKHYPKQ